MLLSGCWFLFWGGGCGCLVFCCFLFVGLLVWEVDLFLFGLVRCVVVWLLFVFSFMFFSLLRG